MTTHLPFDWRGASEFKHQLLLVAIIFTPKGLKRLAKSIPIFPYPTINTYSGQYVFNVLFDPKSKGHTTDIHET